MPASILSALAVLFLLFHSKPAGAFYVELAGLVLFIGVLSVTLFVNVPIDNQIKRWALETLPSDWKSIRDRWELYHTVRTFASLGGLGCALASALFF